MIVPYIYKPVANLVISSMPEELKEKGNKNVMNVKVDALRLMRVEGQTKIPPWSEQIDLVATDVRELVEIGPQLDWTVLKQ